MSWKTRIIIQIIIFNVFQKIEKLIPLKLSVSNYKYNEKDEMTIIKRTKIIMVPEEEALFYLDIQMQKYPRITCQMNEEKFSVQLIDQIIDQPIDQETKIDKDEDDKMIRTYQDEIGEVAWNADTSKFPLDMSKWWINQNVFSAMQIFNHYTVYQLMIITQWAQNAELKFPKQERDQLLESPWDWLYDNLCLLNNKKFDEWVNLATKLIPFWGQWGHDLQDVKYNAWNSVYSFNEIKTIKTCFSQCKEGWDWEWFLKLEDLEKREPLLIKRSLHLVELLTLARSTEWVMNRSTKTPS